MPQCRTPLEVGRAVPYSTPAQSSSSRAPSSRLSRVSISTAVHAERARDRSSSTSRRAALGCPLRARTLPRFPRLRRTAPTVARLSRCTVADASYPLSGSRLITGKLCSGGEQVQRRASCARFPAVEPARARSRDDAVVVRTSLRSCDSRSRATAARVVPAGEASDPSNSVEIPAAPPASRSRDQPEGPRVAPTIRAQSSSVDERNTSRWLPEGCRSRSSSRASHQLSRSRLAGRLRAPRQVARKTSRMPCARSVARPRGSPRAARAAYSRIVSSIQKRSSVKRRRLFSTSDCSVSRSASATSSAASSVQPPAKTERRAKSRCSSA